MQLHSAGPALRKAMSEAGTTPGSPSIEEALAAMSSFARQPIDGAEGVDADLLLCEIGIDRDRDPQSWSFSVRRQVAVERAPESSTILQLGVELTLEATPELSALAPSSNEAYVPVLELWEDASDIERWLEQIRSAPAFIPLTKAPIADTELLDEVE